MVLSFKQQFKPLILNESKIHTIREDKADRWKEGMKIHFATGARTKQYECFWTGIVRSIQNIHIRREGNYNISIWIDNKYLSDAEIEELAKNDGFDSVDDFCRFFPDGFLGKIIHWTDFRY
jgi:hypothetical protein